MIPMPWDLKKYWQGRLKDLVEAWSGEELELTDIYGMRQYSDGELNILDNIHKIVIRILEKKISFMATDIFFKF